MTIKYLLSGATATGAGTGIEAPSKDGVRLSQNYQAKVAGTGTVTASVDIEVSNDGATYDVLATITLSGTTSDSDAYASPRAWAFVRGNVTAISGTNAAVTLTLES